MSNNQQPGSDSKNIQYASTAPSVASLINLPQVQDKKKPVAGTGGLAVGGIKMTPGLVGKPLTLGLKKTPLSLTKPAEVAAKPAEVSAKSINYTTTTTITTKTEDTKPADKLTLVPVAAKVEKPKTSVHKDKHEYKRISPSEKARKVEPVASVTVDHFDPAHWRLFVGNLGPEVSDSLLLSTFQNPYPSTSKALIVRDWKSQKPKGYGFVAFSEGKEFLKALKEMQGKWIGNRQAIIKKSDHQPIIFNKL